ncbi:transposase domain-containing protein (plasmid) [Azospirillum argentinense]|uniref:Transposase domain-containing protein n=1 Tax=Azospirillum argentinense TaxID=2970906 RepID=A0A4D8PXA1_9PROT|nr:transposase domain-containing protein [Azospirillum argentinense]
MVRRQQADQLAGWPRRGKLHRPSSPMGSRVISRRSARRCRCRGAPGRWSGVNPQTWFADVLTKLAGGHPITKLDELPPWAYARPAEPAVA